MKKRIFLLPIVACIMLVASVCKGQTGIITTYATVTTDSGLEAMLVDSNNNIYIGDYTQKVIKKISSSGVNSIVAGTGIPGYSGDGGPATGAQLSTCEGMAMDALGNLYFCDYINAVVRKITPSGTITTVAGNHFADFYGDGGPATDAALNFPVSVVVDDIGNLYISDPNNDNIRKVDTFGIISTIVGFGGGVGWGYGGDGGPATAAHLNTPTGITMDRHHNLYIIDGGNYRIRKIDSFGMITTFAGNGIDGYTGDGGPATLAEIHQGLKIIADAAGNIFIQQPYYIRKVSAGGIISTVVGNGTAGYSGDGGPAILASFNSFGSLSFDRFGNLYIADPLDNVIRKVSYVPDALADSFSVFIDKQCGAVGFSTVTNSTAPTILATYFGDGKGDTVALIPGDPGTKYASVAHAYTNPGTYTIKEILRNGTTIVDSTSFSYVSLLCKTFTVKYYNDLNGNCTRDTSEPYNYGHIVTEIDSNGIAIDTISSTGGFYYTASGDSGTVYTFKLVSIPPGLIPTCSGIGTITDTLGVSPNTGYVGFSCSAVPGFDIAANVSQSAGRHAASGTIVVSNNYCTPQAGVLTMNINPKYIFGSSSPAPTSVVGNTVTWNLTGLSSVAIPSNIYYTLTIPGPLLTPGDTILSTFSVTPISGDLDTSNNTTIRIDTVKASYDPNEMSVIPGGYILPGTTLQYSINFENTGNDTAHNIAIMDTLSDNVDVNSLRIDAATAVMNTAIYNAGGHNIVKFDFPAINLLDSTHHNQCNGMVMFHIQTKGGLADGTTLFNHAGIFFDDNPVVMTDTVENIISLIHGANSVCIGSRIVLSDLATGGVWTESNARATISGDTVTGVTPGVDTISYTTATKYGTSTVTQIVTVNSLPMGIVGGTELCSGSSITVFDGAGGTWSSSTPAVATIGATTGTLTGISAGTATITYTAPTGCIATKVATVDPLPSPISGVLSICNGSSTAVTDATAGGIWISSNYSVATIGTSLGIVTGVSAGTANISYMLPFTGCTTSVVVTINPQPTAISGTLSLCAFGGTTSLSDATAGGSWSSSGVTVGPTGVVTGLAPGAGTITYALPTGCSTTTIVTVNTTPTAILGTSSMCSGSSTILTDATAGGIWSSSNVAVATVGTAGIVTGTVPGTATISYTIGSGCAATMNVTVAPVPASISGTPIVCAGATTLLSDITAGGTWSSSNPGIAAVGPGGIVAGLVAGTAFITYSTGIACIATMAVTINATPAPILGTPSMCSGASTILTDATAGGFWSSSNPAIATVSTAGIVTGTAAGNATISYTIGSGCAATMTVTVAPAPASISGVSTACAAATIPLSDITAGGVWSSSNPTVGTVSSTGIVTGLSAGITTITYSTGSGCMATKSVTFNPLPTPISGALGLCYGLSTTLTDAVAAGTWNSSLPSIATIGSSTGTVTGVSAGTAGITYTTLAGCATTTIITVNPQPAPVSGASSVCAGSSIGFSDVTPGGTWSSSNVLVLPVGLGTGIATGLTAGVANVTYTLFATGCLSFGVVTVNPLPTPIIGSLGLCNGLSTTLTDAVAGGTWSSSLPAIAAIGSSTGMVTGLSAGTTSITYAAAGCSTSSVLTVNPSPVAISGTSSECTGSSASLSDASAGGMWNSLDTAVATVSGTGLVTGVSAGTVMITYMLPAGCYTTILNTVNPVPSPISGTTGLCVGSVASLTVSPPGGNWASSAPAIATVDVSGGINAVSTGTATISYTLPTGCYATLIVTVNSTAGTITGASTLCEGDNTDLSDVVSGGIWTSSTPGVATVATIGASTGVVIGIAPGVDTITYAISPGCVAYYIVTVYAVPIVTATATPAGCGGTYDLTSAGAVSYVWSPATGLSCATCASTVVNPAATATYTVTGTGANGCASSATVSVNGNRIMGHVIAGGLATDVMKVWLIQFNAADSSLIAQDSMLTCMDGGAPYYEFDGVAPGSYLVKAKLQGSVAGTTGYVPTYGLSTPYWDTAVSISHTSATDTQHISMILGMVPAGPGFIGGLIISGAGRGTSGGAPVAGMLVYLLNATNNVVTYTYTDAAGNYSFSGLGDGSYIVYPEDYKYYTTASATVILTVSNETVTNVNFKQHTSLGTITPYTNEMVPVQSMGSGIGIFPNPASGLLNIQWEQQGTGDAAIVITDLVGREVYRSVMNITAASGKAQLDISSLLEGVYVITIRSDATSFNCKLVVQ